MTRADTQPSPTGSMRTVVSRDGGLSRPAVEAIVVEVIRRLSAPEAPVAPSAGHADQQSGQSIHDRVITLASIERLSPAAGVVMIHPQAVVTPSAMEAVRDRGIRLVRLSSDRPQVAQRPFLVVVAEVTPKALQLAAALAGVVPGAETVSAASLSDGIDRLASAASSTSARGLLLTGRPSTAVILANRSASLRGIVAKDVPSCLTAIVETSANVVICDPVGVQFPAAARIAAALAAHDAVVPADLSVAPAGCGCKTHPH